MHRTVFLLISSKFWMGAGGGEKRGGRVGGAPNGTRLSARCHFTGPKKLSISRAHPLPLTQVMDAANAACINSITHGVYKSINSYS
jgi:hypothetical protein